MLISTGAGLRYGHDHYLNSGCGMGYETTIYLLERGMQLTGTDAWSWDVPFSYTSRKFAQSGDSSLNPNLNALRKPAMGQ